MATSPTTCCSILRWRAIVMAVSILNLVDPRRISVGAVPANGASRSREQERHTVRQVVADQAGPLLRCDVEAAQSIRDGGKRPRGVGGSSRAVIHRARGDLEPDLAEDADGAGHVPGRGDEE